MADDQRINFNRNLFGKTIDVTFWNIDQEKAKKIMDKAYKEALRLQKIFNFYDAESELSQLNKKRVMKVSNELIEVLQKAIFFCESTAGQYDITLGKSFEARKKGKEKRSNSSYKQIDINGNVVKLTGEDALIDLGSIAKGYITDALADFIKAEGAQDFMIDSRGDMVFAGNRTHRLPIQHPRDNERSLFTISLYNEAVATSGDYAQFYGDHSKSHIINSKEIIASTVVAPTLEEADAYATALIVARPEERAKMMKDSPHINVLLVDKDLKIHLYNDFGGIIHEA